MPNKEEVKKSKKTNTKKVEVVRLSAKDLAEKVQGVYAAKKRDISKISTGDDIKPPPFYIKAPAPIAKLMGVPGFAGQRIVQISGKPNCLGEDTLVLLPDHSYKTIKQIVDNKIDTVMCFNQETFKLEKGDVSNWIETEEIDALEIKFRDGTNLITSTIHPFLMENNEWVQAQYLSAGNCVAGLNDTNFYREVNANITMLESTLLAYYIAEGGLTDQTIQFSNTDEDILNNFEKTLRDYGYEGEIKNYDNRCTYTLVKSSIGGDKVCNFLIKYDLMGKYSYEKEIPDNIFKAGKKLIHNFISKLWDCDGYVGNGKSGLEVSYSTSSEKLAKQLKLLLLKTGITSSVTSKMGKCNGVETRLNYNVNIHGGVNFVKFYNKIKLIDRKSDRIKEYLEKSRIIDGYTESYPKYFYDRVTSKIENKGEIERILGDNKAYYDSQCDEIRIKNNVDLKKSHDNISPSKLQKLNYFAKDEYIKKVLDSNLKYLEIKSINKVSKRKLYDITVDNHHNFITEGIISHNSGKTTTGMLAMVESQNGKPIILDEELATKNPNTYTILVETEGKFSEQRFRKMGGDPGELLLVNARTLEQGFVGLNEYLNVIYNADPDAIVLVVWDSIGGTPSAAEVDAEADESIQLATAAKIIKKNLRVFVSNWLDTKNIAFVAINQNYANIGSVGRSNSGGEGLEYHSSLIMQLSRTGDLLKQVSGEKVKYGIKSKGKVTKNHLMQDETTLDNLEFEVKAYQMDMKAEKKKVDTTKVVG